MFGEQYSATLYALLTRHSISRYSTSICVVYCSQNYQAYTSSHITIRSWTRYVKPFHYRTLQLQVPGSTCDWLTVPVTGHIYSAVISWNAEVVAGSFSPQLFNQVRSHSNHYTTSSEIKCWGF